MSFHYKVKLLFKRIYYLILRKDFDKYTDTSKSKLTSYVLTIHEYSIVNFKEYSIATIKCVIVSALNIIM